MLANRVSGSIPEIAESFSLYTPLKSQKFAEIDGLTGVLRWNSGEQKHQNNNTYSLNMTGVYMLWVYRSIRHPIFFRTETPLRDI